MNLDLAPPAKTVDGLLAIPVGIQASVASFLFDGATQTASADATITYEVGPTGGNPIFDLRQTIAEAWLDGSPFPVAKLAHHTFGTGSFTDLRVIEAVQAAGSIHTLRVRYNLALPNSQMGGSYLPALEWSPGPRLKFVFGLSDLNRARYAEAWLPANLLFDQYRVELEIQIINTMSAHSVITTGAITSLAVNHWRIMFPARSSAVSPLLEVRAADSLQQQTDTVVLPVSGNTVTIEAWKPISSPVALTTEINNIKSFLTANENNYGVYVHGSRFVAFFNGSGGMEYEGGTTTSTSALRHETFHSWFARGIKPSSQADGWWDEGFTRFHDQGADDAEPFDFTRPPVLLCSRDPWQRHTPSNSYDDGFSLWRGIASLLGVPTLNSLMRALYEENRGNPVSTQMIEEFLLRRGANALVVDAFHRFVYGFADPSSPPNLWLKDDAAHDGTDQWDGPFWDSPDLWIRNADDGGVVHQSPEYGQDNWFYARVRNRTGAGEARHFAVTFHARGFVGTEFVYPGDFLPATAAATAFELAPGASRLVKARWPRALVPPQGSHTCLLAAVIARGDHPVSGRQVREHNNLAQKNVTIVDLEPNTFAILPVVVGNLAGLIDHRFDLELWRPEAHFELSLIHPSKEFFSAAEVREFRPRLSGVEWHRKEMVLDCGGRLPVDEMRKGVVTSLTPDFVLARYERAWEWKPAAKSDAGIQVQVGPFSQVVVGLKVEASAKAPYGKPVKLHLVQRHAATGRILGGIAVQVNVVPGGVRTAWDPE